MSDACVTCGYPKFRPTAHSAWCWTADPTQPVAGGDLAFTSAHDIVKRVHFGENRHPEACAVCGCVRRHGHWCSLAPVPSGCSSGSGGEVGGLPLAPASLGGDAA